MCRSGIGLQERQESIPRRRLSALLVLLIGPSQAAGRAVGPHGSLDVVQSARVGLRHGPLQVRVCCGGLRQLCKQVLLPCWPLTLLHALQPLIGCTWRAGHQAPRCGAHQWCSGDEQLIMSTDKARLVIEDKRTHLCPVGSLQLLKQRLAARRDLGGLLQSRWAREGRARSCNSRRSCWSGCYRWSRCREEIGKARGLLLGQCRLLLLQQPGISDSK